MILYLVRHGQTAHNRDGVSLGRADVPLSPLGELQAAAVARTLAGHRLDRVFASPLDRAMRTASALAAERHLPIEVRPELIELDAGDAEGLTFPELRDRFGDFLREWAGPHGHEAVMPGGESMADLDRRLTPLVDDLHGMAHEAIAVVSHNFVLRVLFCRLIGLSVASFRTMSFDVASISALALERDRVAVVRLNDCCHLDALNLDPGGGSV